MEARRKPKLAELSAAQRAELESIEARAVVKFSGQYPDLEAAIGMLRLGHHFGWRVLYLVHSKQTVRKYERILGIKVRELFPKQGQGSDRNRGFRVAQTLSNFWKIVSGEKPVKDKQLID